MSVREYAVLYLGKGGKPGAASGGGNVVLTGGGAHALDGPEHTTTTDQTRLDASTTAHGLLPKLSGDAGDALLGDGTWGPATGVSDIVDIPTAETDPDLRLAPDGAGGVEWAAGGALAFPWYDVKVDGACVGNGIADDTAALQAAIDAATASGTQSATLYFPPGTYLVAGNITLAGGSTQINIRFRGAAPPPMQPVGPLPAPHGYSIIKATATTGTAVFDGGSANIQVYVEDLICIAPDNPTITFWNLAGTYDGGFRNVQISTVPYTGSPTYPTHSGAYGVTFAGNNHANGTLVENLSVGGFYTCILLGELTTCINLILGNCVVGVQVPFTYHASLIVSMQITRFTYGIRATGTHYLDVLQMDTEHGGSPFATTYDLDDASNDLHGYIRWLGITSGVGVDHSFVINGGANVLAQEVGPAWGGTGSGTPASTVTDETTWGITPAVGSDTEYARQDHTHGSPAEPVAGGGGELLVADATGGVSGVNDSSYVEMTTQRTTTSATLVDITGASTTITLTRAADIAVWMNCEVSASGASADLGLAINIDGTDHDTVVTHLAAGAGDSGVSGINHRTGSPLAPGTYTVTGRFKRAGGAGTPAVDRADLLVMSMGAGGPVMLTTDDGSDFLYSDA